MMDEAPSIRPAEPRDHEAMAEMIRRAFVPPAVALGITTDNCPVHPSLYTVDWICHDIDKGRRFFVLERDGELFGCVGVRLSDDGSCELTRLAVPPELQRRGYGAMLTAFAERYAAEQGVKRIELHMLAELDDLRRWYERRGYRYLQTVEIDVVPRPVGQMAKCLEA